MASVEVGRVQRSLGTSGSGIYASLALHFWLPFGDLCLDVQPAQQTQRVQSQANISFLKSMTVADFSISVSDPTHLSHPGLQTCCRLCFFSTLFPTVTSQRQFSSPVCLSVLCPLVYCNRHQTTSVPLPLCLDYSSSQLPSTLPRYSLQY